MTARLLARIGCLLPGMLAAQAPPALTLLHTLPGRTPISFGVVQDAVLGDDGTVTVLDIENVRLYRFTPAGTLRDSLGGRGRGPGELQTPGTVTLGPAGDILVGDLPTLQLVRWTSEGRPAGLIRLAGRQALDLRTTSHGTILLKTVSFRASKVEFMVVPPAGDSLGRAIASFPLPPGPEDPGGLSCLFCAWAPWPAGGVVVAAPDTAYTLTVLTAGGAAGARFTRGVPPRRRSAAELAELGERLRRGPGGMGGAGPEGRPAAPPTVPPFHPRVVALEVDRVGRLWVLAQNGGERQAVLDLFDPAGRFLGTVRPAEGLRGVRIAGDRLVGWGEDAAGEPVVWVYRIGG